MNLNQTSTIKLLKLNLSNIVLLSLLFADFQELLAKLRIGRAVSSAMTSGGGMVADAHGHGHGHGDGHAHRRRRRAVDPQSLLEQPTWVPNLFVLSTKYMQITIVTHYVYLNRHKCCGQKYHNVDFKVNTVYNNLFKLYP